MLKEDREDINAKHRDRPRVFKLSLLDSLLSDELGQFSETTNLIRALNTEVNKPVFQGETTVKNTLVHKGVNVGSTEDAHNPARKEELVIYLVKP